MSAVLDLAIVRLAMADRQTFSCFIMGADTLLTECAELILKNGHDIRGVITGAPRIEEWARKRGVPVLDVKSDYASVLKERPFDWLFSITHLSLIPGEVLSLAARGAINFHDGPLPGYAGLNTPAWGLIHREPTWGITFHLMTAGIDDGAIVKQRLFEVAPKETSLSLNTRNFATAIEAFGELISDLESGRLEERPQDITGRKLFSRHHRPEAGGLLDFTRPAVELDALVRALDFGRYANPLGLAKVSRAGEVLCVLRAEARDDEDGAGDPGQVIRADDAEIVVGTREGTLALLAFSTLEGKEVSVNDARVRLGLEAGGGALDVFSEEARAKRSATFGALTKAESFWASRLGGLEPLEIPHLTSGAAPDGPHYHRLPLKVPASFAATSRSARAADAVLTAYAAYLARISGKDDFHLSLHDEALTRELGEVAPQVSPDVPVSVALDLAAPFAKVAEAFERELVLVRAKKTFPRDLIARTPELHGHPELAAGRLLPVGAAEVSDPERFVPPRPSVFTLALAADGASAACVYDASRLSREAAEEMRDQLETLMASIGADPARELRIQDLLDDKTRHRILTEWNATAAPYRKDVCIHQLIEEQVARTPDATALVFEGQSLTYRQMNARANQLAAHLRKLGVGPDKLVGIYVERSLELVIAVLATQKAGGAYLPLDPAYPQDRIAFMVEDSKVGVIIAQERLVPDLPASDAQVVKIDGDWPTIATESPENTKSTSGPNNLAYVIYTSGSTGRPKGVEIEHRNVVNFFTGMDERLAKDPPGTWLAVTSLSFDIHVLELSWTLARGFKVVIYLDRDRGQVRAVPAAITRKGMQFGLFMWGNDDAPGRAKYDLMLKGSKYFDEHGFDSVWTPERHFHAFGGPYPNPSVTGAAIAAITSRVKIRAGSCVSPLHHPIRIAEEWSVLDNLSDGRVGLSFAAGWQPNDFVLRPENHKQAKKVMMEQIDVVRRLWRGEAIEFMNPLGQMVPVTTLPRPVQKELPFWVTTAGNPDTYREAGYSGANVLTHLLGQSVEEVAQKIKIYREARKEKGLDPNGGTVTLMLHTFVGHDVDEVRELVRQPMKDYLSASVSLVKNFAWAFPAFKRPQGENAKPDDIDLGSLTKEELDGILEFAFERYFVDSGLFGTPESCMEMVNKLKAIGVDEIACLLDFGVATDKILDALPQLNRLRELANEGATRGEDATADHSIAAQIRRHQVTHLQCTPSMARMLLMQDDTREALRTVRHVMIGGEAFPVVLAKELGEVVAESITNMYGPTETTIWSSTHAVKGAPDSIPIGRPIANTQLYVLDKNRQVMPPGVPGELYIAGDGVVRGYLFRPELTRERFVPDPFSKTPGARMYKTGDLARFRRDGVVDFLGRTDHQVKIRGYRIELGEIETLLSKQPGVRECVVVLREDTPGDQRLVGYYVPQGEPVDPAVLKDGIRAKLPEYMVPSHFAPLSALPLTPNGKIDRKRLPSLDSLGVKQASTEYVAPSSEIEAKVAKIWQETLNKERIGIEDNFFDIGGHSLLVVRMHRKLREVIDAPVSLTDLYRFPTIRAFTEYVTSDGSDEALKDSADRAAKRKELLSKRRTRRPRGEA